MIIFVYGADSFRAKEKVEQLKSAFREKFDSSGLNITQFPVKDSDRLSRVEFLQAARSLPFLGTRRMIIVRQLFQQVAKADEKLWLEGLSELPETTIIILWDIMDSEILQKKLIYKKITALKDVHAFPFPLLSSRQLEPWIKERVQALHGAIEQRAVQELVMRVGSDLWQMSHEIQKLFAYAGEKMITLQHVQLLVSASFEGKIFALMDALSKKQKTESLRLLAKERQAGADDQYLFAMLFRQLRLLIVARFFLDQNARTTKEELAKQLGVHPYVASKALSQAHAFSMSHLKELHSLLLEMEDSLKTGRIQGPDLAVDLFISRFLSV